ncbi:MAG: HEAT repeat domain-containing protein [Phycisphaerales bacterium JB040]
MTRRTLPIALASGALLAGCGVEMRPGAKSLFEAFAPPTPTEAADMALSEDPDERFKGLQLLANAPFGGGDPYLELYADSLQDEDPGVRWAAVSALGRHGGPEHVELVLPFLDDEDPLVRSATARALQRIHEPVAIEPLLETILIDNEPVDSVRAQAADALGQYASRAVLQGLVAALDDSSLAVNRSTLRSLETLTGQNYGLDQRAWLDWIRDAGPDVFAARRPYVFPTFQRDRKLVEYLPLVADPPNESPNTPVGMPPMGG